MIVWFPFMLMYIFGVLFPDISLCYEYFCLLFTYICMCRLIDIIFTSYMCRSMHCFGKKFISYVIDHCLHNIRFDSSLSDISTSFMHIILPDHTCMSMYGFQIWQMVAAFVFTVTSPLISLICKPPSFRLYLGILSFA